MISQLRKEELVTASPNLILIPPKIENIPSTHLSPHFSVGGIGWLVWFISKTGRKDWEVCCKPSVVHVDSCCPPPPLQQGSFTPSPTPAPSGRGNPPGSLPLWVQPTPSVDGRAEISPAPIQPGPPEPWKTSQGDTGLCCGPSSSSEVVVVVEAGVAVAVVLGVAVVVASFAPAFPALRTDRGRLILERPTGSWHCCPPRRLGGMGNSRAAAWHPVPQASPQPRVFLFLSCVEAQVSKARLLFLTAQEKEAGSLFIEFPEPRETPLFRSLSASQRDTHSLCIWPWEASRSSEQTPREVSAHNFMMKAFKTPIAAALLPQRLGGWARCPQALRKGVASEQLCGLQPLFSYKESGLWGESTESQPEESLLCLTFGRRESPLPAIPPPHPSTVYPDTAKHHSLQVTTCPPTL